MANKSSIDILTNAKENLETAKYGLDQFRYAPIRNKISGFKTFVIFARSVIDVLKQLRNTEQNFEKWGKVYLNEIKTDPLIVYFNKLRSLIIHFFLIHLINIVKNH